MICLIPVSRFRVQYEVAAGRPYSQLEALILRAIKDGTRDVGGMRSTFQVHPRILIEALVTLTQAGWVAASHSDEGGFLLTAEGEAAVGSEKTPSTTVVTPRTNTVLLERVTGGLIGSDEVRFNSRSELRAVWDDAVRLRADVNEGEVDEGHIRQMLRRSKGEWVRWVGPIELIGKNAHWVVVSVDVDSGTVIGLPERWEKRLAPTVIEEARHRRGSLSAEAQARQWVPATEGPWRSSQRAEARGKRPWPIAVTSEDLLFHGAKHLEALLAALRDARSSAFIASAFLSSRAIEALRAPLREALGRGVSIDLLWGYGDGSSTDASPMEELKRLAYDAKRTEGAGTLRFNREPSGSHAKLVLADSPAGMTAIVGSYNWLSAVGHKDELNASIVLREPGIVAEAAASAAALWAGTVSESLSSTPDRWRNIAAELESITVAADEQAERLPPIDTTAQLVFDRDHDALVREWSASAQTRLFIFSHRLGPAGEPRLMPVAPADGREFVLCYGLTDLDEQWRTRIAGAVARVGGTVTHVPRMHAKVVVSDSSVCISSYNFLSADPFGTAKRARELGVVLEGEAVARTVAEQLTHVVSG